MKTLDMLRHSANFFKTHGTWYTAHFVPLRCTIIFPLFPCKQGKCTMYHQILKMSLFRWYYSQAR